MDVKNQITRTTSSGHENHGTHLCHKCGWAFPNPHPSAKHRRAHKKICGTIDGYNTMIRSEVRSDDDKEKSPSPKIEEKMITRVSFSRSEDEVFSDAVTEFSDSGTSTGSANKTFDKDLFFSFKDGDNDGTNELLNDPIDISKVDTDAEVSEKTICDSTESNLELTETGLVKDGVVGPVLEPSHISDSQETKFVDFVEAGEEKSQESQTSESITKEAKDSELTKTFLDGDHDNVKQGNDEKIDSSIADGISEGIKQEIKSDHEHVSEVVNEDEIVKETNIKKFELDYETASEVVKELETDHSERVAEDFKDKKLDFVAPIVQIEGDLTEKTDLESHELKKSSIEQIQEVVNEPDTVLTEKDDLGGPHLEKQLNKHTHESFENPVSVLTEKQNLDATELEKSSIEQIQEFVKKPDTVLTEKDDLGGPHLKKQLNKLTHESFENPVYVLTEKQNLDATELEKSSIKQIQEVVKQSDTGLTEKADLGGPHLEEQPNKHNHEVVENLDQRVDNDSSVVADVSVETRTQEFSVDNSVGNDKNASDVVHVANVEEGKINNQDSGVALSVNSSTRSSLEGNWGSVSVLSTASIDTGTLQLTEKSKVNSRKSNATASDVSEPQSSTTLANPESKDKKPESSEPKDSQKQPNSEVSESGKKRNEELIAKVTNWTTGKQSASLKNLLGEAKSPGGARLEPVVQKDEAVVKPLVNDGVSSPPKLIDDDDKKARKKVKGFSSWVPFVCCSSVNVVN